MIPLSEPTFQGRELEYLQDCIQSGWVSAEGPYVSRFERAVESLMEGHVHATACSSGSAALQLALMALGLRRNELVLVPAISFMATLNPILHLGAEPLVLDIEELSLGLSALALRTYLENETLTRGGSRYDRLSGKRIFGLVAASLYGMPCRLSELQEIAKRYGLKFIEDNAEALGARHRGLPAGSFGDAAILSFNGNKTLTAGGGGMVVSPKESLVQSAASWANQCRLPGCPDPEDYGFNLRLSNLQAAVGFAQIERAKDLLARRNEMHELYRSLLSEVGLSLHETDPQDQPAWWLHLLVTPEALQPAVLQAELQELGIQSRVLFTPFGRQKLYKKFSHGGCPVAEKMWASRLALPSSAHMTDQEIATVVGALEKCLCASPLKS
jgi:perosamine synthetase